MAIETILDITILAVLMIINPIYISLVVGVFALVKYSLDIIVNWEQNKARIKKFFKLK